MTLATGPRTSPARPAAVRARDAPARWAGLAVALVLVLLAFALPPLLHWRVLDPGVPPLLAAWDPHVGPGTLPAVAIGVLAVLTAPAAAARVPWRLLLAGSFVVALAWILALATSQGLFGIDHVLGGPNEFLQSARAVTDVGDTFRGWIDRIPLRSADPWPTHVTGHPAGALLFFVLLVRIGLGSGLASGLVVVVLAATTPAAVLITLRRLGAEGAARRAAPLLAVGPSAIWLGVSADALFQAVAAWGLCCLAVAATAARWRVRLPLAIVAGLLLGACVMLSYGLPLLGVLALAVLLLTRAWWALPVAAATALLVVLAFAAAGFVWWDAYPVLVDRYWDGVAHTRPFSYWVWGDLAGLVITAGPLVGAGLAVALVRLGPGRLPAADRAPVVLAVAAAVIVLLADLSQLSKAEVERIWLPFVPWLVVGAALLPDRWRRLGLAGGVAGALAVEHLLRTAW